MFDLQGHHSTNSLDFLTNSEQEALADTHSQQGVLMIFMAGGDKGRGNGERERERERERVG